MHGALQSPLALYILLDAPPAIQCKHRSGQVIAGKPSHHLPQYDNEQIIGDGLEGFLGESPQNRSKLFITSKVWNDCHRPELIR